MDTARENTFSDVNSYGAIAVVHVYSLGLLVNLLYCLIRVFYEKLGVNIYFD
jgi:hypothetical protein